MYEIVGHKTHLQPVTFPRTIPMHPHKPRFSFFSGFWTKTAGLIFGGKISNDEILKKLCISNAQTNSNDKKKRCHHRPRSAVWPMWRAGKPTLSIACRLTEAPVQDNFQAANFGDSKCWLAIARHGHFPASKMQF